MFHKKKFVYILNRTESFPVADVKKSDGSCDASARNTQLPATNHRNAKTQSSHLNMYGFSNSFNAKYIFLP